MASIIECIEVQENALNGGADIDKTPFLLQMDSKKWTLSQEQLIHRSH